MTQKQPPQGSTTTDEQDPIRSIQEIEADFQDEWVEIEVTKMADDGFTPLEGRLMAHGKNQDELNRGAKQYRKDHAVHSSYRNYTGEMRAEAVLL